MAIYMYAKCDKCLYASPTYSRSHFALSFYIHILAARKSPWAKRIMYETIIHCYNYLLRPSESPPLIDESNSYIVVDQTPYGQMKWIFTHWNWCGARHTCVDWRNTTKRNKPKYTCQNKFRAVAAAVVVVSLKQRIQAKRRARKKGSTWK